MGIAITVIAHTSSASWAGSVLLTRGTAQRHRLRIIHIRERHATDNVCERRETIRRFPRVIQAARKPNFKCPSSHDEGNYQETKACKSAPYLPATVKRTFALKSSRERYEKDPRTALQSLQLNETQAALQEKQKVSPEVSNSLPQQSPSKSRRVQERRQVALSAAPDVFYALKDICGLYAVGTLSGSKSIRKHSRQVRREFTKMFATDPILQPHPAVELPVCAYLPRILNTVSDVSTEKTIRSLANIWDDLRWEYGYEK
ncbi:hypothetical protein CYMTET_45123, partial [Cymbomonas tetramitiformis]